MWESNHHGSSNNTGDGGLIPGSGRSPGGGNDNPLAYSCLKSKHLLSRLDILGTMYSICQAPIKCFMYIVFLFLF